MRLFRRAAAVLLCLSVRTDGSANGVLKNDHVQKPRGECWMNEVHNNNIVRKKTKNFIEIGCPSGSTPNLYQVHVYLPVVGLLHKSYDLSGLIPKDTGLGVELYVLEPSRLIRRGGLALTNNTGNVIQTVAFSKSFMARNGPAKGQKIQDAGVREESSAPLDYSLQMAGVGCGASNFHWQAPLNATRFGVNSNQDFHTCLARTAAPSGMSSIHLSVPRNVCFKSRAELYSAVDSYLQDKSNSSAVALKYGWPIGTWCVSKVTNFDQVFDGLFRNPMAQSFNEDISGWDVSKATSMSYTFLKATSFNQPLSSWVVSKVTDMYSMFGSATSFNQDISKWDVSKVEIMSYMFAGAASFNQPLSPWNTSNARDMGFMFKGASSFNQDLSGWYASRVTSMASMFHTATSFNQGLAWKDTSSLMGINHMFHAASNSNNAGWNVSNVVTKCPTTDCAEEFTHSPSHAPSHPPSTLPKTTIIPELLDPSLQPKFEEIVPNALSNSIAPSNVVQMVGVYSTVHKAGLRAPNTHAELTTDIFAYGTSKATASWPGPTIMAVSNRNVQIKWTNQLFNVTDFPFQGFGKQTCLDSSIHWAFSISGYSNLTIGRNGIPVVPHLHGIDVHEYFDGYPEAFFTPGYAIKGPKWTNDTYLYENVQPAAALWYHDHTLGITRLNVYSGLAGFYIIRDQYDTGLPSNPLGLPTGTYEKAYVIQDRMFQNDGNFFWPAFKGDPNYDDFIVGEEADWDSDEKGATAFAEFFGDYMLVNGKIWPKDNVEANTYRLRLLNGCDSRTLVIELRAVAAGALSASEGTLVSYTVIGSDQGLLERPIDGVTSSLIELGGRLDIIVDLRAYAGKRIIMTNLGGDSAFGGEVPGDKIYEFTDRIMALDVSAVTGPTASLVPWNNPLPSLGPVKNVRSVALFEGRDEYGRLQPMLGGMANSTVLQSRTWSHQLTETPTMGATEDWIIYNFSPDAHPIHVHLVYFTVVGRYPIMFDSSVLEDEELPGGDSPSLPAGDRVYLSKYPMAQHDGSVGTGVQAIFPGPLKNYFFFDRTAPIVLGQLYSSERGGRKDIVMALPGQATIIRMRFNRRGRYVWHCHILSHEDHEMMRPLQVL